MPNTPTDTGWRIIVGVSAVPLLAIVVTYPWLPESPRFDMLTGNRARVERVLASAARANGVLLPPGRLLDLDEELAGGAGMGMDGGRGGAEGGVSGVRGGDKGDTEEGGAGGAEEERRRKKKMKTESDKRLRGRGSVCDLFAPSMRRTTFLLWAMWFTSAFCYYGIILLNGKIFLMEEKGQRCPAATASTAAPGGLPSAANNTLPAAVVVDGEGGIGGGSAEGIGGEGNTTCLLPSPDDYRDIFVDSFAELPGLLVALVLVYITGRKKVRAVRGWAFLNGAQGGNRRGRGGATWHQGRACAGRGRVVMGGVSCAAFYVMRVGVGVWYIQHVLEHVAMV